MPSAPIADKTCTRQQLLQVLFVPTVATRTPQAYVSATVVVINSEHRHVWLNPPIPPTLRLLDSIPHHSNHTMRHTGNLSMPNHHSNPMGNPRIHQLNIHSNIRPKDKWVLDISPNP